MHPLQAFKKFTTFETVKMVPYTQRSNDFRL